LLIRGWAKATPSLSLAGRPVREYRLTPAGRRQLELEQAEYARVSRAITTLLEST
jgi:hypothetical protein